MDSEIYFPTFFRNFLCDTGFLMDLIDYYSKINLFSNNFDVVREDIYLLIRIFGRILSASDYVFGDDEEKDFFRTIKINFMTRILK
jgi:hypothetical protein